MSTRLKNVRSLNTSPTDLSAGFQTEFFCECCDFTWRSPFKPYRTGQFTGWLTRLAFLAGSLAGDVSKAGRTGDALTDAGFRRASEEAFEEAQGQARRYFTACPKCKKQACDNCLDESRGQCADCNKYPAGAAAQGQTDGGSGHMACPNCQAPSGGGRFCHECGFDMASTHKGCPACGSVMPRAARFCTDCGHGF